MQQTFSNYGASYLRFLLRVILFTPRHISEAIALAVMGHHFFTITREILKADALSILMKKAMVAIQSRIKDLIVGGRKNLAAELEHYVLAIRANLQKRYSELSRDVQEYLRDVFSEFEAVCEAVISEIRLHAVPA